MKIVNRYTQAILFDTGDDTTDIRSAVLSAIAAKANLRGADLSYANLSNANLSYANLSGGRFVQGEFERGQICTG